MSRSESTFWRITNIRIKGLDLLNERSQWNSPGELTRGRLYPGKQNKQSCDWWIGAEAGAGGTNERPL